MIKALLNLAIIDLHLISSLVKHGNSSVAGLDLGLSQSSVSYRLKKLRVTFSDELFTRTTNGLVPTEYCRQLERIGANIVNQVESDLYHAGDFNPLAIKKEIWLSIDDSNLDWIPEIYQELKSVAPYCTLCVRPWNPQSFNEIKNGTMNFGIHVIPANSSELFSVDLTYCNRALVVREGHYLSNQHRPVSLSDLTQFPVILHDLAGWNNFGQSTIETAMSKAKLPFKFDAKIGVIGGILNIIKNSNAIAYVATNSIPEDINGLNIISAPKELDETHVSYKMYIPSNRYGSQESTWMIEFLSSSFKRFSDKKQQIKDKALSTATTFG
ncbi:LysR family transcriptional regulator [Ferrimonas lipolytica]|uniref:LysR family transcriptional regulator n=1 Tax=Ferrimonas lipolytica TaxID=2724191 RepID=A0A6H1UAY7_9GAMM|nr:LysR family transcriptional regulator [Ferrimonas lipolytica]QIZ75799.1 LysR family transcriptional regulator [Ferrimonas lipolytica]